MDLGECPKVHDLALRADYEKAAKHKDYYYDIDVSIIISLNRPQFIRSNFGDTKTDEVIFLFRVYRTL